MSMFGIFNKSKKGESKVEVESEGVLSNLKTISRWVQDLPAGDIYGAQEKVVQRLIEFNHAESSFTKDRLEVLMHLDASTRDIQSSLCMQYMRNARMSTTIESKFWTAIHAFYWEITRGYHSFLMDFVANPGGSNIQSYIPLITARALRGFADIIKWHYFHNEQVDAKTWLRLHNLYRIAEFDNFSNTAVTLYRTDSFQHTPAQEYGQALILSLFSSGNLTPRKIELIDQWLSNWSDRIRVDKTYNAKTHAFYVDTGNGHGLRRVSNTMPDPAALRFISTTDLLEHLHAVTESLKSGSPPVSLGLSEDFRLPEGYSLIDQVEKEWAVLDDHDRRTNPRIEKTEKWKVIHGLSNICNELSKAELQTKSGHNQLSEEELIDIKLYGFVTERTKDRQLIEQHGTASQSQGELWQQADVSDIGIGFNVDLATSAWVKVGKLVAICPLAQTQWRLAIVTRLAKKNEGDYLVGLKLFQEDYLTVSIKPDGSGSTLSYVVDEPDPPLGSQTLKAILLTDQAGNEQIIIDSSSYARNRQYYLHSPFSQSRLIRLESVEGSGESWLKVNFKVVSA